MFFLLVLQQVDVNNELVWPLNWQHAACADGNNILHTASRAALFGCEHHSVSVQSEREKVADAAELQLIRPSGWWQQVGSCGDFVNLYLGASSDDRQTDRCYKHILSQLCNQQQDPLNQNGKANFLHVFFSWGLNEQAWSNFLWWKLNKSFQKISTLWSLAQCLFCFVFFKLFLLKAGSR